MLKSLLFCAATFAFVPNIVSAQDLVFADSPERIASLLENVGYPATIGVDNEGDPLITSSVVGYDFDVFFHGCDEQNENCSSLRFYSRFDLDKGLSLARAHEYNLEERWVKIYMNDENDPIIEMDYNLYGGVSVENFNDTFDWWTVQMEDFIGYIGF